MLKCKWKDIQSYNDESNSKITVMAYDIECNSSHGDFPLPKKDYLKLVREIQTNYQDIPKLLEKVKNNLQLVNILNNYTNNKQDFINDMIKISFQLKEYQRSQYLYECLSIVKNAQNSIKYLQSKGHQVIICLPQVLHLLPQKPLVLLLKQVLLVVQLLLVLPMFLH